MKRLCILVLVPSLAFAQPTPEPVPEVDPPPVRQDGPRDTDETDYNDGDDGTRIEGDLYTDLGHDIALHRGGHSSQRETTGEHGRQNPYTDRGEIDTRIWAR